jgi:hypothetical protein
MKQDEIIKMAIQAGFGDGIVEFIGVKTFQTFAKLVAAKEREACAKICEDFADVDSGPDGIMQDYHAHLIRARGEA